MITVVTSYNADGYRQYGHRFLSSFVEFWPTDVNLIVYEEGECDRPANTRHRPNLMFFPLDAVGVRQHFMSRYGKSNTARGLVEAPSWRRKDRECGYSFRTDAVKFSNKVFALYHAAKLVTGPIIWIDADVVTLRPVTMAEIDALMPRDSDLSFLGRPGAHSECGFMAFRTRAGAELIDWMAGMYMSGEVFSLTEWHDSFVFDRVREKMPEVRCHSLSAPGHQEGHVWIHSPLGAFMDHLKGARKEMGASPEMAGRGK